MRGTIAGLSWQPGRWPRVAALVAALLVGIGLLPLGERVIPGITRPAAVLHRIRIPRVGFPAFNQSAVDGDSFARNFPARSTPPNGYSESIGRANAVHKLNLGSNPWHELGPFYVPDANVPNPRTQVATAAAGRITTLAADPRTCGVHGCGTIYVGAGGGGVWKTVNGGKSWSPILDSQPNLTVGAIALDPLKPDTIYVGTGNPSHEGAAQHGVGIFRSVDGGHSWTLLGAGDFSNRAVTSILIDPRTAGTASVRLYVSTTWAMSGGSTSYNGDPFNNPYLPHRGIYVSDDSGQTWKLINPPGTGTRSVESVLMDPAHPDTLYAGYDGHGIYRTTNGGQTWTKLGGGLPTHGFEYLKLAMAYRDPRVLYAAYDLPDIHPHERIYRTSNGGKTWTLLGGSPAACGSQCSTNLVLAVDPSNPNVVYAGGTANYHYLDGDKGRCRKLAPLFWHCSATIMKSTNAGRSWADIGENGRKGPVHPDAHTIFIDPKNPKVVYVGADGGVFWTRDGGRSWRDLNRGLRTFQINAISVDSQGDVYAGTQDNGTLYFNRTEGTWRLTEGEDGGFTATDPRNQNIAYVSQSGASLERNDHHGRPFDDVYIAAFWADYEKQGRGNFYEPFALAPSQPSDIFYGTYRVWRSRIGGGVDSNNDGATFDSKGDRSDWVPISFDLSCGRKPKHPDSTCDSYDNNGEGISAIAVSPVNPNVVVAASSNGHLWLTRNALALVRTDASCDPRKNKALIARCNFVSGVSWTRIDQGLPHRFPTSVTFWPGSSSKILVSYSGFDENSPGHAGHIFMTTDAGLSWLNLSGIGADHSLPDLPFSDVVVNPNNNHIYAAADYGVYASDDGGATWNRIDQGLPAVSVYQMALWPQGNKLVAGTYGRGVWEITAP